MKRQMDRIASPVLVVAAVSAAVWVSAGQLDPPPGAIEPTMKDLDTVEPRTPVESLEGDATALYVIDQPGSYYLTGNIQGEPGKNGIRIQTQYVTLDLSGFALTGGGGASGIAVTESYVIIRNGIVRDWSNAGVWGNLFGVVEDVQAFSNGSYGIYIFAGSTVSRCTAGLNSGWGIVAANSLIRGCCAVNNSAGNIGGDGATLVDNHAP